jgi:hypothetical protein
MAKRVTGHLLKDIKYASWFHTLKITEKCNKIINEVPASLVSTEGRRCSNLLANHPSQQEKIYQGCEIVIISIFSG